MYNIKTSIESEINGMQNKTLHIACLLFSIIQKASSSRKLNLINMLTHRGGFVNDGK